MQLDRTKIKRVELLDILDVWDELRGERDMPREGEMGPIELAPFLQNLMLVDVHYPGPRIQYKQVGLELERVYGKTISGKFLDEMPKMFRRFAEPAYTKVLDEKEPSFAKFRFVERFWIATYERLMLPLHNPRSGRVSEIIVAIYPKIKAKTKAERDAEAAAQAKSDLA
jgi:hypothetical protein